MCVANLTTADDPLPNVCEITKSSIANFGNSSELCWLLDFLLLSLLWKPNFITWNRILPFLFSSVWFSSCCELHALFLLKNSSNSIMACCCLLLSWIFVLSHMLMHFSFRAWALHILFWIRAIVNTCQFFKLILMININKDILAKMSTFFCFVI